jgi:hypothetical protein
LQWNQAARPSLLAAADDNARNETLDHFAIGKVSHSFAIKVPIQSRSGRPAPTE